MVPGQEIAIRAIGTALAGMSIAIRRLYARLRRGEDPHQRPRTSGDLRPAARQRGRTASGGASRRAGRRRRRGRRHDATTGSFAASAGQAAPEPRPVEIVAAPSGSRLAEDRRRAALGRSRRQRAWRRPYRGDCRARRRLGPARRQGRALSSPSPRARTGPRSSPAIGSSNNPAASSSLDEFAPRPIV